MMSLGDRPQVLASIRVETLLSDALNILRLRRYNTSQPKLTLHELGNVLVALNEAKRLLERGET